MKNKFKSHPRWILITGLSGSGKTTALKIFEDQGFFPIDNLPIALLPSLISLLKKSKKLIPKVVLGMDARDPNFLTSYPQALKILRQSGIRSEVLFLESNDKVLVRRFSENRRPHPLGKKGGLLHAITEEKKRLQPLRDMASKIFDTSKTNIHDLKKALHSYLYPKKGGEPFTVTLLSFGFKFGIPVESDLFFDVRFLDNPYFVPRLKDLDGNSPSVQKYVLKQKDAKIFIAHVLKFLDFFLPRYQKGGKSNLTVALGCTGGKHRSVVIAQDLQKRLHRKKWKIINIHRDIHKIA